MSSAGINKKTIQSNLNHISRLIAGVIKDDQEFGAYGLTGEEVKVLQAAQEIIVRKAQELRKEE